MNPNQISWTMARAKAHAPLFIGNEDTDDSKLLGALSEQMRSWSTSSERDETARIECRRLSLMLAAAASGDESCSTLSDEDVEMILSWQKSHGETAAHWGHSSDRDWARDELAVEGRLRLWMGRWGASGLPLIKIPDANWVAAMCATNVSAEFLEMMRLPWPAFAIDVPPGTGLRFGQFDPEIRGTGADKEDGEVSRIGVHRVVPTPGERVLIDRDEVYDGSQQWVCMMSWTQGAWKRAAFMHRQMSELGDDLDGIGRSEVQYGRCQKMISKLVAGVLMAMQAGQVRQTGRSKKRVGRREGLPICMEYLVGHPVHVRMVDFVRDFVAKGPRKMRGPKTVQTLVRGHWKWQPHGPRNTLRKWQHIEPYWSGQATAPIVVRPHILTGSPVSE